MSVLAVLLCITACTNGDQQAVKSIEIVEGSFPTQVNVGETPDFSGIKIKITYTDDTTKEIGYSDVTVSELDTSTAGVKTLTVTYGLLTLSVDITVVDPNAVATVTAIKIVPGTVDAAYYIGQTPDMSRLQVEATYSDGKTSVLSAEEYTRSSIDTSTAGKQTFTVTLIANSELTDSVEIEVIAISSMQVVKGSVNNKIFVGETLDTLGIEVLVEYANGESEIVGAAELTLGTVDSTTHGKKELSITYRGVTIKYAVEVVGPVSLTVNKGSYAEKIKVNGTFDASGITAYVTYSDETAKSLTAAELTVGTLDTSKVGKQSIKISYGALETAAEIEVIGVESLTVVDNTVKKEILKGTALDTSAISVSVKYTDGTTEFVGADKLTLGDIDENKGGEQTLAVTYLDKTVNYAVKVCEVVSIRVADINKVVSAGDPIDISTMKVYGVYNDSAETEILLTDGISTNVDSLDKNSEEDKTLVVSYDGAHGKFSANVIISTTPPELVSIEITVWDKLIGLGGEYNTSGVNVYASYANETKEKITDYSITKVATDKAGDTSFTVTYTENDVTVTATAAVKVLPITKLDVSGIETSVYKGNKLDTSAIKVLVTFSDGVNTLTREVGAKDVTVSDTDTSSGGDKKLTVTYLGSKAEVEYHVITVSKIEIFGGSVDSEVRRGYAVDYSNLVLNITYSNGHSEQKKASELTGVTYEGADAGSARFVVAYEGCTAELALSVINVVRISALNNTVPAVIEQGKAFPYDSIRLSVYYDNGDVYLVKVGQDGNINVLMTPTVFDTTTSGMKAISFEYSDGSATFTTSVNIWVKGVVKVEIVGGILDMVTVGHDVDTSEILVKVTYDDGTYVYVNSTNPNLIVHSVDTSKVGDVTLKVEFSGVIGTMTITVKDAETLSGIILGALLPDELVARESYKKNFKDSTSAYRVGDDNPYYFYLNVIQLDENDDLVEIDGKLVPTAAKIYLVENGAETELTGSALTDMVAFDSSKNSYDFTDAAVGKTFRLEIRPADASSYVDEKSVTKSHTVTVVNGWNIYHARELNIATNVRWDVANGDFGDENIVDQKEAVTKFLAKYGIVRPENLAGIVLHCNLDVKPEDLPPEYFFEYTDKNGVTKRELYDHFSIYNVGLTMTQKTFDIYGNYYSIYSYNIPCVTPKGVGNNGDEFSSSELFKIKAMHSNLPDSMIDTSKDWVWNQIDLNALENGTLDMPFAEFSSNIIDLATRDNDPHSNDQTASERHMRGIICFKVGESITNFTNVNIEAYMISACVEHVNSTTNLNKVNFYNAWQGHLFLWNHNQFQAWRVGNQYETKSYIQDLIVNITDSSLTKCGGPVILAQAGSTNDEGNHGVGIDVRVDDKSDLHTYVTGQEAWFVAVGQTQLAAQIKAMSALISAGSPTDGYVATDKIQGVETINMVMVNMGAGMSLSGAETYNGSFTKTQNGSAVTGMMMSRPDNKLGTFKNPMYEMYSGATGGQAPVFQSSAGGTAYTDGATGCYGIETGGPGAPLQNFYQGDYITLYYMGVGVMMEYYHAPTHSVLEQ